MDRPVRVAFCKLLFSRNGGSFTASGLPIFSGDDVRGSCDRAYDCGECSLLHDWLAALEAQGWSWGWECHQCLKDTEQSDEDSGVIRKVQGFYQEGRRDKDPDEPTAPALPGCTRCAFETSFLQLVIRKLENG